MVIRTLFAMLALSQAAGGGAAPDERIATVAGPVRASGTDPDDWLRLVGLDARLMIPAGDDRELLWALIALADAAGVSLRVRVDAAAGRLAPAGNHLIYPICAAAFPGSRWIGDEERNCPAAPAAAAESERLLALGVANAQERTRLAREQLGAALAASPPLTGLTRALALKARAEAAEWLSADEEPGSREHDRLMVEALNDYRALAELIPDNPGIPIAIAQALRALGAYDDAERLYRDAARRWPEAAFEAAVQWAALERQRGEYGRSLRRLDDYARSGDPQVEGMKYNYHRAWTLGAMGRDEEAVRHLDEGLRTQPDYHAAYLMRSCLQARLGRLAEALADQRLALDLLEEARTERGGWFDVQAERSRSAIALLERAIAANRSGGVALPCEDFWDHGARPRARSPLLPAG